MKILKLWFEDEKIFIHTDDGQTVGHPLSWYPRLLHAAPEQRMNFEYDEIGIHWPDIDEDLSVAGFFYDDPTDNK